MNAFTKVNAQIKLSPNSFEDKKDDIGLVEEEPDVIEFLTIHSFSHSESTITKTIESDPKYTPDNPLPQMQIDI